jgi:hypothetical protein
MEDLLKFLKEFNIQTILSLFAIVWYFSRHIEAKFESKFDKFEIALKSQSDRTDQLYQMFIELLKEKK